MTTQKPIEFQILDWNYYHKDEGDDEVRKVYHIRLFGKTRDQKSIYVDVEGYTPNFYVKVEKNWKTSNIDKIIEEVKKRVFADKRNGLVMYRVVKKYDFYGFTNYTQFDYIQLIFNNFESMRAYENAFKKKIKIRELGKDEIKFKLYESNIEPHIRCMHVKDLDAVGWVKLTKYEELDDDDYTCCDINIKTSYTNLEKMDERTIQPYTIAAFDIECTSSDGGFPQPERDGDKVIQIGTTFSRFGEEECYYKHIICLGETAPIEGVVVEHYDTEIKVLLAWTRLLRRMNPDIITGYNIFGFDFEYLYKRSIKLGIMEKFSKLSRINEEKCIFQEKKLASSALGQNILKYYDMTGRVLIDLMKVAQRDFKLDSYKLDYVSAQFIRDGIQKIEHDKEKNESIVYTKSTYGLRLDQFITVFFNDGLTDNKHMEGKKFKILELHKDKIRVKGLIDTDIFANKYKVYWCQAKDDVSPQDIFRLQEGTPKDRAIIAKYCVMDCELCNKLMAKLQILTNNIGMANVCHVPLSYIFMRGQGVKIFSLVSKECRLVNHLIPVLKKKKKEDETINELENPEDRESKVLDKLIDKLNNRHKEDLNDEIDDEDSGGYEGAIVFNPQPGVYYEPIPVLDYNSLYPSSMIQRNLSHECNIGNEKEDDKYGYLKGYKYHEIVYNNTLVLKEVLKEHKDQKIDLDLFKYTLSMFIPKVAIKYTELEKKNRYKIQCYKKSSEEQDIVIENETTKAVLNNIITDNMKHIHSIFEIFYQNMPRLVKYYTGEEISKEHDEKKNKYKFYKQIYKKRRLWIELDYTEKEEKIITYTICKFAEKEDGSKGIIPTILKKLLDARKHFKNLMEAEPDYFKKSVLDGLQLAYKVTANSLYGQTGAPTSSIYMKEIAASTTATGREMLQFSKYFIENKFGKLINLALTDKKEYIKFAKETFDEYPHMINVEVNGIKVDVMVHLEPNIKIPDKKFVNPKAGYNNKDEFIETFYKKMNEILTGYKVDPLIIYGDSVMPYTPILCRLGSKVFYQKIEDIQVSNGWYYFGDKEMGEPINGLEVWSDKGFTRVKRVIRHQTDKAIYRVETHKGLVDVTEDHSLLDKYGNSITPYQLTMNYKQELLHKELPKDNLEIKLEDRLNNMNIENSDELFENNTQLYFAEKFYNLHKENPNNDYLIHNLFDRLGNEKISLRIYENCANQEELCKYKPTMIIKLRTPPLNVVYDLETENHHFAAGVGELVVHNTDSVFFNPKITDLKTGEIQKDQKALETAIQLGIWASETICKLLPDPQKQAYEKVLYPFAILTKKRYIGNLYEEDPHHYKQKSMGIVLKRRDNAPIVKIVFGGIVDQIINMKNPKGAVEYTRQILKKILSGKYPIEKFIITKTLRESYADRTRIVHAVLADRMADRDPGNKPMPNDRIPYVYQEMPFGKEIKLQGDRVEHPEFVLKNKIKLDYLFYITNQIMKPCIQMLELLVDDPENIFNEYIIREENRREGIMPVSYYLKDNEKDNTNIESEDDFKITSDSDKKEMKKTSSKTKVKSKPKKKEKKEVKVTVKDSDEEFMIELE